MLTPTRTPTAERAGAAAVAVLAIERAAGGGHAITELRRGTRVAPRILDRGVTGPGAAVRAAFVPTQAGPLSGDRDSTRIVVGAGATLIVEPVAATLALPGAARTVLTLDITVRQGGRLVFDEGPLIVAAGAFVERRCTIELEAGAVAAVRETVVLGREGEPPGALDSATRVTLAGVALLHDGLRFDARDAGHVALSPDHRVIASVSLLGLRPRPIVSGSLDLEGPGALLRVTGSTTSALEPALACAWTAWAAGTRRHSGI
ncbi:MAG: urease accessory protein [bacterium]|jgi:urease accessory protein